MENSFGSRLMDLLFPPKCPFCRALLGRGEEAPCSVCQAALPWLAGAAAEQKLEFVTLCVSPLLYQGETREAIHRYKFQGLTAYADSFGRLIAQCACDHLAGRYDVISWVPLSRQHLRRRGYDQARLLAEAAATQLGTVAEALLRKPRNTTTQSSLSDESARRANVLGAYQAMQKAAVAGRRVLLIDDVVTSGSTLSECARILRTGGASEVFCATLAWAK